MKPVIGITCDNASGPYLKYESNADYARAVALAGGVPILLPQEIQMIPEYLRLCAGFILSGGDDPDTVPFGQPVHPKAELVNPARQAFESALIQALEEVSHPVLGICMGMQMMALHAGGKLEQHLPDKLGDAAAGLHRGADHTVIRLGAAHPLLPQSGQANSSHHQGVADPGKLRVAALAHDGVIEAIEGTDPGRFYLGVQWHPERTKSEPMGLAIIRGLVERCGG